FAAMAKVPADRPQNAAQFAELLGAPLGATASMRATLRHTAARRVPTAALRAYQPAAPAWWRRSWVIGSAGLVLAGGSLDGNDLGKRANFVISRDSLFAAEEGVARNASQVLRELLGTTIDVSESRARARNLAAWTLYQRAEKTRKDAEQAAKADPKQAAALLGQADSLLGQAAGADDKWIDPIVLRGQVALQRSTLETDKAEQAK